jgi:hypothetical protein
MRRVDRLGFGRLALPQEDRQDDEDGGRQKLALPVLEGFEPEFRIEQIA